MLASEEQCRAGGEEDEAIVYENRDFAQHLSSVSELISGRKANIACFTFLSGAFSRPDFSRVKQNFAYLVLVPVLLVILFNVRHHLLSTSSSSATWSSDSGSRGSALLKSILEPLTTTLVPGSGLWGPDEPWFLYHLFVHRCILGLVGNLPTLQLLAGVVFWWWLHFFLDGGGWSSTVAAPRPVRWVVYAPWFYLGFVCARREPYLLDKWRTFLGSGSRGVWILRCICGGVVFGAFWYWMFTGANPWDSLVEFLISPARRLFDKKIMNFLEFLIIGRVLIHPLYFLLISALTPQSYLPYLSDFGQRTLVLYVFSWRVGAVCWIDYVMGGMARAVSPNSPRPLVDSSPTWCCWFLLVLAPLPVSSLVSALFLSPGFSYGLWPVVSPSWAVHFLQDGEKQEGAAPPAQQQKEQEVRKTTAEKIQALSPEPWIRGGWGFHPAWVGFFAITFVFLNPKWS